jgi:hypothetical protein
MPSITHVCESRLALAQSHRSGPGWPGSLGSRVKGAVTKSATYKDGRILPADTLLLCPWGHVP